MIWGMPGIILTHKRHRIVRKVEDRFFFLPVDRQVVSQHLPLAQTQSSPEDETLLMTNLEKLAEKFSAHTTTTSTEQQQA